MDGLPTASLELPALTPDEIESRFPVWSAFSDLFLDTDPTLHYPYIRRVMAESPYTHRQLWLILWLEVTPAFQFNLSIVTGEWAGWSDDFIRRTVLAQQRRKSWLKRLLGNLPLPDHRAYVEEQWQALLASPPEPLP